MPRYIRDTEIKDGSDQVLVGKFTMHGVTKDVWQPPFEAPKARSRVRMGNTIVGFEVNAKLADTQGLWPDLE